jgi:DNA-binding SARP family transcriptional activator
VDLLALRPRVRSLLQLLALDVDRPVHREAITESLWPGVEPHAAARNLHVAIASLRRVLEPDAKRGDFRFVPRDGDRYLLALPPGSQVDVEGFEHAVAETRAAERRDDVAGLQRWAHVALDRYGGDLLPEQGPAEWVVARRDALRSTAVDVATSLARLLLDQGDNDACAAICSSGLRHDRFHDPLWRTLIAARHNAGDLAAARSATRGYRRALEELGVGPLGNLP